MRKLSATILLVLFTFMGISQDIEKEYNRTFWKLQKSDSTIFVMSLRIKGDRFSLTSREGSSKDLLGFKYFIGRIMGRVPSTILNIKGNYSIKNDSILLSGKLHSLYEKINITGNIKGGAIELKSKKPFVKGHQVKDYKAARNYAEAIDSVFTKTKTYLFNPELLTSNEWDRFYKRVSKQKYRIKDDFEFTSTFNYLAYRMLPFSHYAVVQKRPQKTASAGSKSASTQ